MSSPLGAVLAAAQLLGRDLSRGNPATVTVHQVARLVVVEVSGAGGVALEPAVAAQLAADLLSACVRAVK